MPQSKEDKNAYMREYGKTPIAKKIKKIGCWKSRGIIVEENDWDYFHDLYLSITNCQKCKKELTTGKRTHSTKCVDHDHNINDKPNVRMICCTACNLNDNSRNTSGEPNIYYFKPSKCWRFKKRIQGKNYCKTGFKTKQEAIDYKLNFLASTLSVKKT